MRLSAGFFNGYKYALSHSSWLVMQFEPNYNDDPIE